MEGGGTGVSSGTHTSSGSHSSMSPDTIGWARGDGDWATPTPGLRCCPAETSAWGEVDVGVTKTKSIGGGEKRGASRSHVVAVVALRVASAWSRRRSPRAPPSEIVAGGGEGVPSSCEAGVAPVGVVRVGGVDWTASSTSGLQYFLSVTLAGGGGVSALATDRALGDVADGGDVEVAVARLGLPAVPL